MPTHGSATWCARSPSAGALADTTGYAPDVSFAEKVELLEAVDVVERLELAVRLQRERLAELQVRRRIREDVESGAQGSSASTSCAARWTPSARSSARTTVRPRRTTARIAEASMPDAVREQAEREVAGSSAWATRPASRR